MPPKVGYLNDPIIAGLVAAYEDGRMSGTASTMWLAGPMSGE
jgi:hypothetical protein